MMGTTRPLRITAALVALSVLLLAGCTWLSASDEESGLEAELTARALGRFCTSWCAGRTLYVRDHYASGIEPIDDPALLPDGIRAAIRARVGPARFVSDPEVAALRNDQGQMDGGAGILVSIGPVTQLREDVVGVEIGAVTGALSGHGEVVQFQWDGEQWQSADPEDTGIAPPVWEA